jgi:hypothetical protein
MCFGGSSFWSHYPSNIYDTTCSFGHAHYPHDMYHTTKSLCFEGVLFIHMINMSSWLHYPSNILPYINSLCFEGVLFGHAILARYTTHNSTFRTPMPYSSKFEYEDVFDGYWYSSKLEYKDVFDACYWQEWTSSGYQGGF